MVKIKIDLKGEIKSCEIQNSRVEEILEKIPKGKLCDYFEMYILIGDTVINYASLQTSEETLEKYFGNVMNDLKRRIEEIATLKETVEKEISDNLPTVIKEKIEVEIKDKLTEFKGQVEALKTMKDNLPDKIKAQLGEYVKTLEALIETAGKSSEELTNIVGVYRGAPEKGKIGEDFVYITLTNNFKEDKFDDVSTQKNYADIKATSDDMLDLLIEVKNYQNPVPSDDVDKFWRDLEIHGVKVGCFISLGTHIRKIGDFRIENNGDKIAIFMNAGQFLGRNGMEDAIKLAYFISKKFGQYLKRIESERAEEGILRQKIEYITVQISNLKNKLRGLEELRGKIGKIEKMAKESITFLDELYRDTINNIDAIMKAVVQTK